MSHARQRQLEAEQKRERAEHARVLAERARVHSEAHRVTTELDRMQAEEARVVAAGERDDGDGIATHAHTLGPYSLETLIGSGGMGLVYRGRDPRLDRQVAIKIYREGFDARFEREAHTVAALNHPNICTLFDVGRNYLVMEFVEGQTLAERIAEGALPPLDAIQLAQQIVQGLAAAHQAGVVHRDLTPANIKIRPDGVVKILDFGLSKKIAPAADASDTTTAIRQPASVDGVLVGTLAYMSPEQAQGLTVDLRTDIWSLGIVLYQMLAQRVPFSAATVAGTLLALMQRPTPRLSGVSPELQRIVDRCLRKDPSDRYPSADALGADLDACAAEIVMASAAVVSA